MISVWEEAARRLAEGRPFVLAAVTARNGSSPGALGAVMLVLGEGGIVGTVGGGKLEADAIAAAGGLKEPGAWTLLRFDLAGKDAAEAGMICGGMAEVLLRRPDAGDLPALEAARDCDRAGGRGHIHFDTAPAGAVLAFAEEGDEKEPKGGPAGRRLRIPMRANGTLYVFGGGHVGMETAILADRVGFRTVVLDDRAEFVDPARFPAAQTVLLPSFEELPALDLDADSYVVIATRGHLHDFTVLDRMLRTRAGYVGMVGSARKREMTRARLAERGHPPESFDRVRSPIGLAIGSESPAEIAVSIVAELIRFRARNNDKAEKA